MTIRSAFREAFEVYDEADHMLVRIGSLTLVWYDGEWHERPVHGLVGPVARVKVVMETLKKQGGYITIEEPPHREKDRPKPKAWRQVYLVRVEPGGKTCEIETA